MVEPLGKIEFETLVQKNQLTDPTYQAQPNSRGEWLRENKTMNEAQSEADGDEGTCKKCGKPFWRDEISEFGRTDMVRYDSVERPGYCVDCEGII
jgi:hypothetical protein